VRPDGDSGRWALVTPVVVSIVTLIFSNLPAAASASRGVQLVSDAGRLVLCVRNPTAWGRVSDPPLHLNGSTALEIRAGTTQTLTPAVLAVAKSFDVTVLIKVPTALRVKASAPWEVSRRNRDAITFAAPFGSGDTSDTFGPNVGLEITASTPGTYTLGYTILGLTDTHEGLEPITGQFVIAVR
jgi:hypothetical protein